MKILWLKKELKHEAYWNMKSSMNFTIMFILKLTFYFKYNFFLNIFSFERNGNNLLGKQQK